MSAKSTLLASINALPEPQKSAALAIYKQAESTGVGISANEITYITNNLKYISGDTDPKTFLGTADQRITANTTGGIVPGYTIPTTTTTATTEPAVAPAPTAAEIAAAEKAANDASFFKDANAVFTAALKTYFPGSENDTWINKLFEAAKPRLTVGFDTGTILDLMLQNGETPKEFNDRFSGIFELDKRRDAGEAVYVPSISEYVAGEEAYARLMSRMGMSSLGTIENYGKLVGNVVSLDEVTSRIADAYNRISNLDDQVMAGLKEQFPSLSQADLIQAVLTKETPYELQNRIIRSEIGVEAKQAGVVSQLGLQTLQEAGVDRARARQGFQALAEYQRNAGTGIAKTQSMFKDETSATDLKTELEKEALLGQTSKTRKRLESQARAQFAGTSGITSGSLSRRKQI